MECRDLFIIGGGINGAAIAADAAGRRLSVTLIDKGDIASATSSSSTKLIHGGLRYLELYEFNLVKKSLGEREILMRKAPHLITPLQFILPYQKHLRPIWMIRIGLFLYDHLSRQNILPRSKYLNLKKSIYGDALQNQFDKGFTYYDCFTDDARLTLANALAGEENGANILNYHEFISAIYENDLWKIIYKDLSTQKTYESNAKVLINAAGPWVDDIQKKIDANKIIPHKLVKGSHIVVPKLYNGNFAYILQNIDDRIVFTIPYQNEFTLIGTTDVAFSGNLNADVKISSQEEIYLCEIINTYFQKSISVKDILWSYAGVRSLQSESESDRSKDLSEISRDYKIQFDTDNHPPLVTIIGGKITTHRSLAEETLNLLKPYFPSMTTAWTALSSLPGGNIPDHDFDKFLLNFKKQYSWIPDNICERYARNYGTRAHKLLENTHNIQDLGTDFTNGLYEKELIYLIKHEWAKTLDDILWRRTKLGLSLQNVAKEKISAWLKNVR